MCLCLSTAFNDRPGLPRIDGTDAVRRRAASEEKGSYRRASRAVCAAGATASDERAAGRGCPADAISAGPERTIEYLRPDGIRAIAVVAACAVEPWRRCLAGVRESGADDGHDDGKH